METRQARLIIGEAGGTAGSGAKTYKISIPSQWVREMRLDAENRELELTFDGETITIRKPQLGPDFAATQHAKGHDVRVIRLYDQKNLCTTIYADFTGKELRAENYTQNSVKTAFGAKTFPTWEDLRLFLEERCIPRARDGLREYVEALGLDAYDAVAIIQKTAGRMAEDQQWVEISQWK